MARLIVIQGGREKSFDLIDDIVFVGSAEGCGIRVSGAAEKHSQILKVDGAWRLVHLGQGTTEVNGQATSQHELGNGDVIKVGEATLTFRGGVRPNQAAVEAAAAAPPPPAPAPAAGGGGGRSAGGGRRRPSRRGGTGRRGGKEVQVGEKMQRTAGQREVLTRRNARKPGLSGPQTAAIATGISVVVIVVIWMFMKSMAGGAGAADAYAQAKKLYSNSKFDQAKSLLRTIPESAGNYPAAQRMITEIENTVANKTNIAELQWGITEYENNIKYFVEQKILNPKYDGDLAYVRVLIARCKHFLVTAPNHNRASQVKALLEKYEPMVAGKPLEWHDVHVMSDTERGRAMYGPAHKMVRDWLGKNGATGDEYEVGQAERLLAKIERGAAQWWDDQQARARQNVRDNQVNDAYGKYLTAQRRFRDWPEMLAEADKHIADLKAGVGHLLTEN